MNASIQIPSSANESTAGASFGGIGIGGFSSLPMSEIQCPAGQWRSPDLGNGRRDPRHPFNRPDTKRNTPQPIIWN